MKNDPKIRLGFSLIELMVALMIVGILASIAYPSYLSQIQKSKRASAKTALLDLASRQARYYSTNNAYTTSLTTLGYASAGPIAIPDANSPSYNLTVAQTDPSNFTATATPQGAQATDACGSYTVNNLGVKGAGQANCW